MSHSLVAIKVNVIDTTSSVLKKKVMPPIPLSSATTLAKIEIPASKNVLQLPLVSSIAKKLLQQICKIVWQTLVPTPVQLILANKFATTMRRVTNPARLMTVVLINVQVTPPLVIKIVCPHGHNAPTPSLNPTNQTFPAPSAAAPKTKPANGTTQKTITMSSLPMLETLTLAPSIARHTLRPASLAAKRSSKMIHNA